MRPALLPSFPHDVRAALLLAMIALSITAPAGAAIRTWPGPTCAGMSLNNCIGTAADGDVIELAANDIDENINTSPLDKSLTLRPAAGFHPTFAFGRDLFFAPQGTGDWTLRITGLRLDGVRVAVNPRGVGIVELDHLDFLRLSGGGDAIDLQAGSGKDASRLTMTVHDNHIVHDRGNGAGIKTGSSGAQLGSRMTVVDNLIETDGTAAPDGSLGILVFPWASGTMSWDISHNRVQPRDWHAGEHARVSMALYLHAPEGTSGQAFRISNNTWVATRTGQATFGAMSIDDGGDNLYRIVNNTVLGGAPTGAWIRMLGSSSGVFANNLVHGATGFGIRFLGNSNAQILNHHNAVFGAPANAFVMGPATVTSDPLLMPQRAPRPVTASPLVDAGDIAAFSTPGPGPLPAALPLDGDGLRRLLGAAIDIGAYEHGAMSVLHDSSGLAAASVLSHPALDAHASAVMQITRSDGLGQDALVLNPRPMSQSYAEIDQHWRLLADDGIPLNARSGFNLLVAPPGGEVGTTVVSNGSVFSGSGTSLPLPWSMLPGNWLVLASATRGAGLSATANPHPIGAAYIDAQWRIINLDAASMPTGAAFALYAQPASRNAYAHTVTPANQPVATVSLLDHPLLNGFPCAIAHVAASGNGVRSIPPFSLHYESNLQRWFIQAETPATPLASGMQFFVVVDPRAVEDACSGPLFGDGFEG